MFSALLSALFDTALLSEANISFTVVYDICETVFPPDVLVLPDAVLPVLLPVEPESDVPLPADAFTLCAVPAISALISGSVFS